MSKYRSEEETCFHHFMDYSFWLGGSGGERAQYILCAHIHQRFRHAYHKTKSWLSGPGSRFWLAATDLFNAQFQTGEYIPWCDVILKLPHLCFIYKLLTEI